MIDGDEWVINGTKAFITNGGTDITRLVTVTAVTGQLANGRKEISAILVPVETPGSRWRGSTPRSGGVHQTHASCRSSTAGCPWRTCWGSAAAATQFLSILDEGRIAIAALAVGLAQGCVDQSVAYARTRMAFGQPIGSYQAIQFKIADMEMRAHTGRLAYYHAAAKMLQGEPFKREARSPSSTRPSAVANAREATQIHGGYGFMNEFPVARMWRDAKSWRSARARRRSANPHREGARTVTT